MRETSRSCGCDRGYHLCPVAERLWRAHMAEPNSAENLPALRATLARYYEHWG